MKLKGGSLISLGFPFYLAVVLGLDSHSLQKPPMLLLCILLRKEWLGSIYLESQSNPSGVTLKGNPKISRPHSMAE